MNTIEIKKENALKAYQSADANGKNMLELLFGKEYFSQKVTDRIKTFLDAAAEVKISENLKILLDYPGIDGDMISAQAYAKLTIIARALNEGWEPDWTDSNEYKYQPYFSDYTSGSGFSFSDYVIWTAITLCGSRLCFKSSELAIYAGKQFIEIYNQFLIIKK